MLSMRNLTFLASLAAAFLFSVGGASAQYGGSGYGWGPPQHGHYNRVIVTHDAPPRVHRRAYPYVRHSVSPLPYQPVPGDRYRRSRGYAPRMVAPAPRMTHRPAYSVRNKHSTSRYAPAPQRRAASHATSHATSRATSRAGKTSRVIRADAEVRIIGNDQMSIRLFRKRPATRR